MEKGARSRGKEYAFYLYLRPDIHLNSNDIHLRLAVRGARDVIERVSMAVVLQGA